MDAETDQRTYLLVHQDRYLESYNHAWIFSHDQVQVLRQLISSPEQQKNLDQLESLMKSKFDELAQTIALEQDGDHAGALQIATSDLGRNKTDEIRTIVRAMQDAEANLFQQQEEAYQRNSKINSELTAVLIVLGLDSIVALLFVFLLRRIERMQEMITICAWSKLIEFEGEWLSIEEYLSRRLDARITHGISQAEAEKMRKLLEYEKLKKAAKVR